MNDILIMALSSYAMTLLLTVSYVGGKFWREPILSALESFLKEGSKFMEAAEYFLECRMCTGFWVSIAVVAFMGEPWQFLSVYGLSYFAATQERD